MDPITIALPIYLTMGKKKPKPFALNLNVYRNAHFQQLNNAKVLFEELVSKRIRHLPCMTKVDLTYRLFFGSQRGVDVANICCIVDKFFCDTLVNAGKLLDDNSEVISNVAFARADVDKLNPRIEVTLSNIEMVEEKEPVQISLSQSEIKLAIQEFLAKQITLASDQGFTVEFDTDDVDGTKELVAYIDIATVVPFEPTMTATTRAPAAKKAVAKSAAPKPEIKPADPVAVIQEKLIMPAGSELEPEVIVDPPVVAEEVQVAAEVEAPAVVEAAAETAGAPVQAAPSIFPNAGSSSPPIPAAAPAAPSKSLFANLKAPSNVALN